ncbi:CHAD domain-containing protein [Flavobacterium paronense]|uniref:CHAD domain-containing protein n=1 Tax=Flavobacterium paronense TaxID=1392775 RepID=A0ABV5GC35_9FLAO|nr:CHAD domain-containing protein [Flavobacterium paronense]MDN3677794.1 CHAD domain-containing protein [Flavobacterium paronense]
MEENLLYYFVTNFLSTTEQCLTAFAKYQKPEGLHRLRVEIKKIKAIVYFAQDVYKVKNDLTKLKQLFNDAGTIRELQINIQLLSAIPNSPERLITKLQNRENILIRKFIRNGPKYIRQINEFHKELCLPKILDGKKPIKKYFKKEKEKANKLLEIADRKLLHRYRTKLKKMMYVYNALPKKIRLEIELNSLTIKKQEKKLGDWHDLYSAIRFFSHENLPMKTMEYFLKIQEKEKKQFISLSISLSDQHI